MKNVILVDARFHLINSIKELNTINVSMAIGNHKQYTKKNNEIIKQIYPNIYYQTHTEDEFLNLYSTDYNLTYEDIEAYRSTQQKVERAFHRYILDAEVIQYKYFTALAFWLGFFKNNKIDMVFTLWLEHGETWDTIIYDIAIKNNIPVYAISLSSAAPNGKQLACITKLNDKSFIDISQVKGLIKPDMEKYLANFQKTSAPQKTPNFKHPYKNFYNTRIKRISHVIKNFFYSPYQRYQKERDSIYAIPQHEIFRFANHIDNMKRLYDKISITPSLNGKTKYIYIPLHQEPEAVTLVRPILTSSLYIIKILSENIPKGWKLYVKEHPATFFGYEYSEYFLKNIDFFRTAQYYKTIKRLKNVELINLNINSNELIKNSMAVASISGTALIQAVAKNKPIIVFGKGLNFVELLQDSFTITCIEDLKRALESIAKSSNSKNPYTDLQQIINSYVFELDYTQDSIDLTDLLRTLISLKA